jgi:hypothetical protein
VATITLNRPEKKNPLTFESYAELRDLFRNLAYANDVRAVVVAGEGGNFCSGGDVFEIIEPLTKMPMPELLRFTRMTGDLVKAMKRAPQPIVAAIDGICAGAGAMIAGIVVEGGAKTLLIRGIGPGLAQFGVEGTLADPVLTLFSGETVIAANDNWNTVAATTTVAEVRDTSARLGAFALAENSRDAVLLIRLEPGRYTARLSGAADGTGIGLVEVYEVQ